MPSPSDILLVTQLSNRMKLVTQKFCKIPYLLWFCHGLEVSSTNTSSSWMLTFEEGKKREEMKEIVFKSTVKMQLVIWGWNPRELSQ